MKFWPLILLSLPLLADEPSSFDSVLATPVEPDNGVYPAFFQIDGRGDWIAESKINSPDYRGDNLGFADLDTRAGYAFPCGCAMISVAGGYQRTWINTDSDLFDRRKFENAYGTLSARFFEDDWTFQGELQINADIDLGGKRSMLYFYGGWGTYEINPCFTTSLGFLGRSGIRQDKFWPVIGFDWIISDLLEVHAVYPVNVAVLYRPYDNLTLGLTTRFINSRHRLDRDEFTLPSGIVEYQNVGEEIGVTYSPGPYFSVNVHTGYMFRGSLMIENDRGFGIVDLKSNGSFYSGGSVFFRF